MDTNEEFELKAKQFYKDTNIWPPGKDMPKTMCEPDGYETRHKAFVYWCKLQAENTEYLDCLEMIFRRDCCSAINSPDCDDGSECDCVWERVCQTIDPKRWKELQALQEEKT